MEDDYRKICRKDRTEHRGRGFVEDIIFYKEAMIIQRESFVKSK